ncbi:GDSL esterase/lipase At5g55050 [Diospyros lotus]|uniref:GDSL esterase/lipase At5g55050 n=1 Tax=Diospyros lotus TaxID=55363 RepID=UPI002255C016|nr:GDSL esterase/lipase At5g55050 [Diospyros lotus]
MAGCSMISISWSFYFWVWVMVMIMIMSFMTTATSSSSRSSLREAGGKVPAIYVFGDSLVDVGNNNHLKTSFARADFPHNGIDFPGRHPTGRFCNGKNSADFLAEKVGMESQPPYLGLNDTKIAFPLTGVNFASGGAGIFNSTDQKYGQSIPLTKQIEFYKIVYEDVVKQLGSTAAERHLSKSLFAVVIGSNDLLDYFKSGSRPSTPKEHVDLMVFNLKHALKRLHDFGGRKFLVAGVGAVGCCPSQRTQNTNKSEECNDEANHWSAKYNQGLRAMLKALSYELKPFKYSYLDIFTVFADFIHSPSKYGFTEYKAACCGIGTLNADLPCLPISSVCDNRSSHVFWDLYHPTEASVRIFVDLVFDGSPPYAVPINVEQLIAAA